jgi:hypothetical protein
MNGKATGSLTAWVVAVLLAGLALGGCSRSSPEQRLRADVAALQTAVTDREVGPIKTLLADDFVGPDGLDRTGAIRIAQVTFLQNRRIGATLGPLEITLSPTTGAPDHATVAFSVALTGGSGALLPDSAQVYAVRTGWRVQGGDWKMTSADWKPAL